MNEMQAFGEMLRVIKEKGGNFRQGNSWDTITFTQSNHEEVSKEVFEQCRALGLEVYNLRHIEAWEDDYNKVIAHSAFNHR